MATLDYVLSQRLGPEVELALFEQLPSTMDEARSRISQSDKSQLVIARSQTAGRGRLNRVWESPADAGLYATLAVRSNVPLSGLLGLSLAVGVSIARTLKPLVPTVALKWPNDILVRGCLEGVGPATRKLCGVLIELQPDPSTGANAILIGLGLNLEHARLRPELGATSLAEASKQPVDRLTLYPALFGNLNGAVQSFLQTGFSSFKAEWLSFAMLPQVELKVQQGGAWQTAQALDVQEDGGLVIQSGRDRNPRAIYSADLEWAYASGN